MTEWLASLTDEEAAAILYDWQFWARPEQRVPAGDDWSVWLFLGGRGGGKTRAGAEAVRQAIEHTNRIALVAPTAADARDVMVEGDSGILSVFPPDKRPLYEPSKRKLTFHNGAIAHTFSGEEPDRLRGPQFGFAWADEVAAWSRPETWDMLRFCVRLGTSPRIVATTTPRPTPLIKALVADPDVVVTHCSTHANRPHLAPAFYKAILAKYGGTRLGDQEIYAKIIDDNPAALWDRSQIEAGRVTRPPADLDLVVVGVDPAATSSETADHTGIVVVGGIAVQDDVDGSPPDLYVLADVSLRGRPLEWGKAVVTAYYTYKADMIVAESNQGGEMVESTIHTVDPTVPVKLEHASRGKRPRAEPVSALYQQGKAHHVGMFPKLEDEMCQWQPGERSPDRMDALVWAANYIMREGAGVNALWV